MPPKKTKLHELAVEVPVGTTFFDASRKLDFDIGKQFASGGFGRIYTCKQTGKAGDLVVKVEPFGNGPLFTEIAVFNRILKKEMLDAHVKQNKGLDRVGLPWIISSGIFEYKGEKLRFMVMPKYETSLESIREKAKGKLKPNDVWNIALAVLNSLQYMHKHKYVHADIKAGNILLEKASDMKTAVLVDFGLARMSASNVDKPDKKRAHNGTALFTSLDAHRGNQPSFRGDLEILAYNILYWLNGELPWQKLESTPDKVFAAKEAFTSSLSTSIQKELKGSNALALKELFELALKTGYADQVDFSAARKTMEKALSGAKSESATTSKSPARAHKAAVATPSPARGKKAAVSSPQSSPEVAATPPTVSRGRGRPLKKPKAVSIPKAVETPKNGESSVVPGKTGRITLQNRTSRKRASDEISDEKDDERDVGDNSDDSITKENKKKPKCKPVSPATKRDPAKMRQLVPGMRNLPKGRRSMVINQISKKYQRITRNNATPRLNVADL